MKQFNEIFDKAMVEVESSEIAMLGVDIPVVTIDGHSWVEFVTWANKVLSPDLELRDAWINPARCCVNAEVAGVFNEKSASALKASGITEYALNAEMGIDDCGQYTYDAILKLSIPCIPNV